MFDTSLSRCPFVGAQTAEMRDVSFASWRNHSPYPIKIGNLWECAQVVTAQRLPNSFASFSNMVSSDAMSL